MRDTIAVLVPYRERFEPAFWVHSWLPLYEASRIDRVLNQVEGMVERAISIRRLKSPLVADLMKDLSNGFEELQRMDFTLHIGPGLTNDLPHVSAARNLLAEGALDRRPDYLFWLDADSVIVKPASAVEALKLLYEAIQFDGVDIVSGMYLAKNSRTVAAWTFDEDDKIQFYDHGELTGKMTAVDAVGLGCCLMRSDVFNHPDIPFPWFVCDSRWDYGEDIGFCRKAREVGLGIWVHGDVELDHIGLFRLKLDGTV